jgi:hypothetical protein
MIQWMKVQTKINEALLNEVKRIRGLKEELETRTILIEDQCIVLRNRLFGKSSEKESVEAGESEGDVPKTPRPKKRKVQLPSDRYPDLSRLQVLWSKA